MDLLIGLHNHLIGKRVGDLHDHGCTSIPHLILNFVKNRGGCGGHISALELGARNKLKPTSEINLK